MIRCIFKFLKQVISYSITYILTAIVTITIFGGLAIVALIDVILGGFKDEN